VKADISGLDAVEDATDDGATTGSGKVTKVRFQRTLSLSSGRR